ncbi:MAG: PilT/PilU family type 4a pilus ATPase [Candidatus Paceibacterota bacterium]
MDYKKSLDDLIEIVIKEGGSDLHLSENRTPSIRVSGELTPLVKHQTLTRDDLSGFLGILLNEQKLKEFQKNKEVDFSYMIQGGTRFRGSSYLQQGAVSLVLRLIPSEIKTLEELNLPDVLYEFTRRKQGFFLVVGPVGHGKSTTLASIISSINKERTEHIITIEDPIEFLHKQERSLVDQREVGVDTDSFQSGLKAMFRQDVDVLMIGEMRDPETIAAAVTAAETGHLVFSTLHTNNAAQTIDRIVDSFPSGQQDQIRAQLSQALSGIFSQRLVKRTSGGLIPAYELMRNNAATANLIRDGRNHEINLIIETGADDGMIDMNRTLVDLLRRGEISEESARAYSPNPRALMRLVE